MKNGVYVIFNNLSNRYGQVFVEPTDAMARKFILNLKKMDPENAEEKELCRIGSMDIETGMIEPQAPIRIECTTEEKLPVEAAKKPITTEKEGQKAMNM